jgi:hypothetical protein
VSLAAPYGVELDRVLRAGARFCLTCRELPSREDIVEMVASNMFGTPVLNNAHRGEVVEMMVRRC